MIKGEGGGVWHKVTVVRALCCHLSLNTNRKAVSITGLRIHLRRSSSSDPRTFMLFLRILIITELLFLAGALALALAMLRLPDRAVCLLAGCPYRLRMCSIGRVRNYNECRARRRDVVATVAAGDGEQLSMRHACTSAAPHATVSRVQE